MRSLLGAHPAPPVDDIASFDAIGAFQLDRAGLTYPFLMGIAAAAGGASVGVTEWLIVIAAVALLMVAVALISRGLIFIAHEWVGIPSAELRTKPWYAQSLIPALTLGLLTGLLTEKRWVSTLVTAATFFALSALWRHLHPAPPDV